MGSFARITSDDNIKFLDVAAGGTMLTGNSTTQASIAVVTSLTDADIILFRYSTVYFSCYLTVCLFQVATTGRFVFGPFPRSVRSTSERISAISTLRETGMYRI